MAINDKKSRYSIFLLCGALLVGCSSGEAPKISELQKGKVLFDKGDYVEAQAALTTVLETVKDEKKLTDAYYLLAKIEEKNKNWSAVFKYYSKVIELDPDHVEARIKLAKLYLQAGKVDKCREMVDFVLAKNPNDPEARMIRAVMMANEGKIDDAIKEAKAVFDADATQSGAAILLLTLYTKAGDLGETDEILQRAIEANPKSAALHLSLSQILLNQNQPEKSEQLLKQLVSIEPEELKHRVRLATFYSNTNQLEKAEKILRALVRLDPKDPQRVVLLSKFLASKKGSEMAEKELMTAIEDQPEALTLRFALAELYMSSQRLDKAEKLYRNIMELDHSGEAGTLARNKLALTLLQEGQSEEAGLLLDEVLQKNPADRDALLARGKLSLSKQEAQEAIKDLEAVLKVQPDSAGVLKLLALAYAANSELEKAKSRMNKSLSLNSGDVGGWFGLTRILMANEEYGAALDAVNQLLKLSPRHLEGLLAKVDIQSKQLDWKGAEQTAAVIKSFYPDQAVGYYRLGQLYQAQGKESEANSEFEGALERSKDSSEPLTELFRIYKNFIIQGDADTAIKAINKILETSPELAAAYALLGEVYAFNNEFKKAEKSFLTAIEYNPRHADAYMDLANLYLAQENREATIRTYRQALSVMPENLNIALELAKVYELVGDVESAISVYEFLRKKNTSVDVATNNLAILLASRQGDESSLNQALELVRHFETSKNPVFLNTLGWIFYKKGELNQAQTLLERAVKQAPHVAIFQYHLGMTFYKQGNITQAKEHLKKAVNSDENFIGREEASITLDKI